jgi:hypothetical protein
MTKLALILAATAVAALSTPASAYQHGHRGHHGHHGHHVRQHFHGHHVYRHAYRQPTYHQPRYVQPYSAPTYSRPVVVEQKPTHECFWAVQKHGYEVRKIWVCKLVEHKPPVKRVIVEAPPAPTPPPAPAPVAEPVPEGTETK